MAVRIADLPPLAGLSEVARSNLRPLATRFSSSTWVLRMLVVVQAWLASQQCVCHGHPVHSTHLSHAEPVLEVDVFTLDVTEDLGGWGSNASDLEGDIGWREGLDLEGRSRGWVVFLEEITGRLAEVLKEIDRSASMFHIDIMP